MQQFSIKPMAPRFSFFKKALIAAVISLIVTVVMEWNSPTTALAQMNLSNGFLDSLYDDYRTAASGWAPILQNFAISLFRLLAVIEFTWTFICLAMKNAEMGEIVAELCKNIMFLGFFYFLLTKSPEIAQIIINSMNQAGGDAAGHGGAITPSRVMSIASHFVSTTGQVMGKSFAIENIPIIIFMIIVCIIVAVIMFIVASLLLVCLVEILVIANGGVIFMGFGASRWTNEIAKKYLMFALSAGAKIFVMQLIIGLGLNFFTIQVNDMVKGFLGVSHAGASAADMLGFLAGLYLTLIKILAGSIVLVYLVKSIPEMVQSMIAGTSFGSGAGIMGVAMAMGGMAASAVSGAVSAGTAFQTVRSAANLASAEIEASGKPTTGFSATVSRVLGTAGNVANAVTSTLNTQNMDSQAAGLRANMDNNKKASGADAAASNSISGGGGQSVGGDFNVLGGGLDGSKN